MKINEKNINVFIAYARKDATYLDELRVHLKPLHRNKTIKIWYDGEIIPGAVWEDQIKTHLHSADIILLLVSANSLASDYFYDKEVKEALERHEKEETIVIPVILSACTWDFTNLKNLQALPTNGMNVDDWSKSSKAYDSIVRGLYKSIEVIQNRKKDIELEQKIKKEKKKEEAAQVESLKIRNSGLALQKKKEVLYINLVHEGNALFLQDEFGEAKEKYKEALSIQPKGKEAKNGIRKCEFVLTPKNSPPKEAPPSQKKVTLLSLSPIQAIVDNMVAVKGGIFQMGDAKIAPPVHPVTLSDFQISKYQVTQAQWRAVMENDLFELYFKGCDQCPVERVSWDDTQDFIKKLNQITGKKFRLPTEGEWEYAAKGGEESNSYRYAGSSTVNEVAWNRENSNSKTHPVGQKKSNELGLYDMSGNVWEWCSDWYGKDYYKSSPSSNPKGVSSGSSRVLRGGSWYNVTRYCRVANRHYYNPSRRNGSHGFRLAQAP